ncbi:pyridoxal phosphate-dependent aminotransferase [Ruegeria lacuscaerulensis]|uniref:pyridoxal phosphate-dependent aminotransferase n=1 Tax=Ruegeria lacuscaerulensis TaxID=55218 RepID=UPI001BE47641|nr:histidinol-phosphate transaminase [Ruegeria lacuscaerulensis]
MTYAHPHIARMSPYALAQLNAPGGKTLISLSQNESLRPPSPTALEAAATTLGTSMLYPDPDWTDLRHALADLHGIDAGGILCGSGSLDLIACLARVFSGPARAVFAPGHAYPFFRTAAQVADARFDTAEEIDAVVSVDALLEAVRPDTGLVLVANPGNPTGTRIPKSEILRLRQGLRQDILLVVDEAYGEFADHLGERCFDLVQGGNTVILRTFSKAYGMAGFRVGWGLFPPAIAQELRKVMNPNNIPASSQIAAAAAVRDDAYMRETCAMTATLRDQTAAHLRKAGLDPYPSFTNFLLLNMGSPEAAQSADTALRADGVFLRPQGGAGLPHTLRMTIADPEAMNTAIGSLMRWKEEYRA